jgi:DNA-binding CsgD family transcriptional regulator
MTPESVSTLLSPHAASDQDRQISPQFFFLKAVLEGFPAGILILTQQGELLDRNHQGKKLCRYLAGYYGGKGQAVPDCIWRICENLLKAEAEDWLSDYLLVLCDDLQTADGHHLQVRVEWLDLPTHDQPCFLVVIEDRNRSDQALATLEMLRYGLTPREREVWMLRRSGRSYQEIADALYISVDTVKRHLKNIYAKRQEGLANHN